MEKQEIYGRRHSLDEALASEGSAGSHGRLEQRDAQELVAEREAVRQALAQLCAEQRRVIALRYGADLTDVVIAPTQRFTVCKSKTRAHIPWVPLPCLLSNL